MDYWQECHRRRCVLQKKHVHLHQEWQVRGRERAVDRRAGQQLLIQTYFQRVQLM